MRLYLVPDLIEAAKRNEIDYEILVTEYPGHAKELAMDFAERLDAVRIYACGGDGTLNEVTEGVWLSKILTRKLPVCRAVQEMILSEISVRRATF